MSMSDDQQAANLEAWLASQIADDAGPNNDHAGEPLAGDAQTPVGGDTGSVPPAGLPIPPPPISYQVGHVRVPEADASRVAQIYTFLRNNPDRTADIDRLLSGQPLPLSPPPWRGEPVAPVSFAPVPPPPYAPSPAYPPNTYYPPSSQYVTPSPPQSLDLEDPNIRYLYDRNRAIEAQLQQQIQSQQQREVDERARLGAENDRLARQQRDQMVTQAVQNGARNFAAAHQELNEGQLQQIAVFVSQTNLARGLAETMPWDQAVEEAMELATPRVLTNPGYTQHTPLDTQRQRTLTALSGSTGSAGAQEGSGQPAPAQDPLARKTIGDNEFRDQAIRMLQGTGRTN